jgi:hypothetical protein
MYILSHGKPHGSSRLLIHLLKSAHSNLAAPLQFTVVGMYQKLYEAIFAAELISAVACEKESINIIDRWR